MLSKPEIPASEYGNNPNLHWLYRCIEDIAFASPYALK